MPTQWFKNWFNSPYYHILYNQRNTAEAEGFINHLVKFLHLPKEVQLLDIACGRGRHAIYLHKKGFNVTGIDLSVANIAFAKPYENNKLHFFVHDMRQLLYQTYFDAAFNLFTSFGYFEEEEEHIKALRSFNRVLKPGGLLILDYFNSSKVMYTLIGNELRTIDNINFHIRRSVEGNRVIKQIDFTDGQHYHFKESVRLFTFDDFKRLFSESGFMIDSYFGSYQLDPFDQENADRLIFICKKV